MMEREYKVILTCKGGRYVARCPEVDDAVGRGNTAAEAVSRLKEFLRKRAKRESGGDEKTES